jgi:hypothetical protein
VNSGLTIASLCVYKDQLMPLGIILGDLDSATKAFADLKTKLDSEKASRKVAQIEVDTFTAQIPTLEDKVNVTPRSEKEGTKPPYVCPECSNHTYGQQYGEQIQYLIKLQTRIFTK